MRTQIAISGWLVGMYNSHHNYLSLSVRDRSRYILFTSCWTVFFSLFYLALFLHSSSGSVVTSVLSHSVLYVARSFSLAVVRSADCGEACSLPGCSGSPPRRVSRLRSTAASIASAYFQPSLFSGTSS